MLQAIALSKSFGGVRAVDEVSFRLAAGCVAGLIGPNGAGKTTLFNLIAGALKPDRGRLLFEGRRLDGAPPHAVCAAGIARTFQIPRPFAAMTVLENLMVAPRRQSGERFWRNWVSPGRIAAEERALRDKARDLLAFLGLEALAGRPARVLSGGQRKLLELGRVLMADPRLILLDEPGAGVNPALLATIVDKIAALNARGIGFLIIEHNMDLVMSLCRPVLVMAGGRLLMEGSPAEVRADARVRAAYLGAAA
ncbi:MAG: ABC transporter ATP-binding protein [Rhodospirillaceae bacterium]|nr:ABC transporter ATP-binding protein [Rhodospirillaceae bacterium]